LFFVFCFLFFVFCFLFFVFCFLFFVFCFYVLCFAFTSSARPNINCPLQVPVPLAIGGSQSSRMGFCNPPTVRMECLLSNKQTRLMFIFSGAPFFSCSPGGLAWRNMRRKGLFFRHFFFSVIRLGQILRLSPLPSRMQYLG
jgi:hypothetical protein